MKTRHPPCHKILRRKLISLAVASCFASGVAQANPTNPVVVSGSAAIQQSGNLLSITNSPSAIINWGSFSIGAGEITRFIQQSQASAVLNRVVGQDPSAILGALQSNGRVFLINPNGILFGAGSQIDVAGLVASTLSLSDADFLAGRMRFSETPNAGSLVNQGSINTASGGSVYLVAPDITNSGIITSPRGEVILAAGKSVELVNPGTPNLRVEINAPDNRAINLGQIVADSGRVGIYAGLINQAGVVQANSAVVGEYGEIVLKATQDITLDAGSVTTANGPGGGSITLQSGDTTLVSGVIEAKGTQSQGGTVEILGNLVGLTGSASVDVSGETGGGTVLVGGDYQGKNPDIQNAYRTYFGPDATIRADAITAGDGGKVIVWSDDATRAYGSISARGGSTSGNGGFVEVSGKNWLDFAASVDTRAPNGLAGTLLLDPSDVTISNSADALSSGTFSGGMFSGATSSTTNISWSTIDTQLAGNSVIITTTGSGGSGNIAVTDSHTYNTANSFSLLANNNITSNGAIINTGSGSISMYAGWDGISTSTPAVSSGTGDINITRSIQTGGNITLVAGSDITIQPPNNIPLNIVAGGAFTATAVAGNFLLQGGPASVSSNTPEDSSASVTANAITITAGGDITIAGGDGVFAQASGSTGGVTATASSNASLSAVTSISLTGNNITIRGGDNADVSASGSAANTATVNASALVSAGTTIAVNSNSLTVRGGNNADVNLNYDGILNGTVNANAQVLANDIVLTVAGPLTIQGGSNADLGSVFGLPGGQLLATINAKARVHANSSLSVTVNGGSLTVAGGDAARASATASGDTMQARVNVDGELSAGGNASVTVSGGNLTVRGGNGAITSASAEAAGGIAVAEVSALGKISAGGNLGISVSGALAVQGGGAGIAPDAFATGLSTTTADSSIVVDASVEAGGNLTISAGSLTVRGANAGAAASANGPGGNTATVAANATLRAIGGAANLVVSGAAILGNGGGATAIANASDDNNSAAINANSTISAGTTMTFTAGSLTLRGMNDALASANGIAAGANTATVTGNAVLSAGTDMNLNIPGGFTVRGGDQDSIEGAFTSDSINNVATTDTSARVSSGGNFVYTGGPVTLQGGSSAIANATPGGGAATARSDAAILIAANKTMNITGDLNILGGAIDATGANASAFSNAMLDPGVANITTTGDVFIIGGFITSVSGGGGTADASLTTTGPLNLTIGGATGLTMTGDPAGILGNALFPANIVFTGGGTTIINTIPGRGSATTMGFGNAPESQILVSNECDVTNPYSVCSYRVPTTGTPEVESQPPPICR
ncbi:MAG: filamentous hemagglutinin N-terminal domain-containing protein [Pseudomonadota bacterium]